MRTTAKKSSLAALFCALALSLTLPVLANNFNVNVIYRVDISSGKFSGYNVDYELYLPRGVKDEIAVDRVTPADPRSGTERLDIYCLSKTKKMKPALVVSINLFHMNYWSGQDGYTKIFTTKDYVVATLLRDSSHFTDLTDKAAFDRIYSKFNTGEKIQQMFEIGRSQKVDFEDSIFVNGSVVKDTLKIMNNTYYLPVRSVCERLGYKVEWYGELKRVQISRNKLYYSFSVIPGAVGNPKGVEILFDNGKTYVSSSYFVKILGRDVEIDNAGNVYVS